MLVVRGGGLYNLHLGDPAISVLFINAPAASSAGHSELPISHSAAKASERGGGGRKRHTEKKMHKKI